MGEILSLFNLRNTMQTLKITATNGTSKLIPLDNVLELVVDTNFFITSVSYVNNANSPTTVAVAAYDGTNDKYEYGHLEDGYIFSAHVANYKTR
jgi:hypothetical protein